MISKAAEKQELIKKYTAHAIVPEEKKSPDDNDRTPTVSFTLPSPAKMNELRLYQETCPAFCNNRTVYRDLSVPDGVAEMQGKGGTQKRIARSAGPKDAPASGSSRTEKPAGACGSFSTVPVSRWAR